MKLRMTANVALQLETAVKETNGLEFSGLGFVQKENDGLCIYDVEIMHVGSEVYTEIDPEKIFPLMDREDNENLRVWFHRHPVGNGRPGPHNWSGMDEATIQTTPMGGIPELVKWSVSIVRTPGGWVGRIDNHLTKETLHTEVHPMLPEGFIPKIVAMKPKQYTAIPIQGKKRGILGRIQQLLGR